MDRPKGFDRADVDGLRAISVLAIIGFHAFPSMVPGGFVGVDVFFVISGYLISTIILTDLASGTFSFAGFYSRRAKRILPGLLLVLVAVWMVGWRTLLPSDFERLGRDIAAGASYLSNIFFGMTLDISTSSPIRRRCFTFGHWGSKSNSISYFQRLYSSRGRSASICY
jgi:peptidoglycan/LPS O-acetylase OafA/YrhL